MTTQQKIIGIVQKHARNTTTPDPEDFLFESGYLDSFGLPDLIADLEKEFGIRIPDTDLNPRKFASIARIENYIESRS